jgi:hypothetical protein
MTEGGAPTITGDCAVADMDDLSGEWSGAVRHMVLSLVAAAGQ